MISVFKAWVDSLVSVRRKAEVKNDKVKLSQERVGSY